MKPTNVNRVAKQVDFEEPGDGKTRKTRVVSECARVDNNEEILLHNGDGSDGIDQIHDERAECDEQDHVSIVDEGEIPSRTIIRNIASRIRRRNFIKKNHQK